MFEFYELADEVEPVFTAMFPANKKITGKFAKSWFLAHRRLQVMTQTYDVSHEFHTHRNRVLFQWSREF